MHPTALWWRGRAGEVCGGLGTVRSWGALAMGLQGWWGGSANPRAAAQGRGGLPGGNCGDFEAGVVAWGHSAGVHLVLPGGHAIDTQSVQAEAALNNLIEEQRCYQNYLSKSIIPCFLLFGCIPKHTLCYQVIAKLLVSAHQH